MLEEIYYGNWLTQLWRLRNAVVTEPNLGLFTRHTAKPIYWHQGVVKESTVFIADAKQGEWEAYAQKMQTPQLLSGKGF